MFVSKRVKWSHEYVLAGQNKDRISYNQLSPIQLMAGFCRSIKEESDSNKKMLQIPLRPQQRPAMRSFYATWNRERIAVG